MKRPSLRTPVARRAALWIAGGVVLVAAAASTTYVGPDDPRAAGQAAFSAEEYVAEAFPEIVEAIRGDTTDLTVLAAALADDPAAAGEQYGVDLGAGQFAYRVSAAGEVVDVDDDFVYLAVADPAGESGELDVRIPLGTALTGTPVRDATGTIKFGDFTDQNEYQSVANQLKLKIQSEVIAPADPPSLAGRSVTVTGAWSTGGPPDLFIVQPVTIEVVP
jgi:predicted lipoprotein